MNLYTAYLILQVAESIFVIVLLISLLVILFKAWSVVRKMNERIHDILQALEDSIDTVKSKLAFVNIFKGRDDG